MKINGKIKAKASIFDDMRAIVSMDLSRNEAKVLSVYRLEMDEESRQVRGKSQDQLRELCGLSEQQFSSASGSLQRRGIVTARRMRNQPQTITVEPIEMPEEVHEQPCLFVVPKFGNSGNRNPEIPETGSPETSGDDSKSAPLSAPESAQAKTDEADDLARQAYLDGLAIKAGKTAKSARSIQRTKGELDGSRGITLIDGKLTVVNGSAATLAEEFPGIDLTAVCNRAAPDLSKTPYPSHGDAMAVLRKWAQIAIENKASGRFGAPRNVHPADIPHVVSSDTIRYAKPARYEF